MLNTSKLDASLLETNKQALARNYWKTRLADLEWVDHFSSYRMEPAKTETSGRRSTYTLQASAAVSGELNKMAVSPTARHLVLLAAMGLFIQRYAAASGVIVFSPVYREAPVNNPAVVPVRISEQTGLSFRQHLVNLKQHIPDDFKHSDYPLDSLLPTGAAINQIFKTGMLLKDIQDAACFDALHPDMLFLFSAKNLLQVEVQYNPDLFVEDSIAKLTDDLFNWLHVLLINREKYTTQIEIASAYDKEQLDTFNNTQAPYPRDKTLVDLFREQASRTPDNIAIYAASGTMTYKELDERSNQLAAYLQNHKGVVPGDLVGIMLEREAYLLPAIWGILKTGAAYVPLDPFYPASRILAIIEDAALKAVISRSRFVSTAIENTEVIINLDNCEEAIHHSTRSYSSPAIHPTDLAYVIYTSGSTGRPKGVMIEHHSVVNRIGWMQKTYPVNEQDVLLQKTPIVFDVSVWELFWWSFTGASLCLLLPGAEKDPRALVSAIDQYKVTTIHFVPSMLRLFLEHIEDRHPYQNLQSLKQVFASGEALKPDQVQLFGKTLYKQAAARLINLYGPTEATVDVSYYECNFDHEYTSVPIGKPIDNTQLYVLDKHHRLSPIGVPGELYIAGVGVARGYLNNKELTQERFPERCTIQGLRLYRTGDLAKWLPNGNIVYLGRSDHQVKVRGYRIECEEIEARLSNYVTISDCVVITREIAGDTCLVACYAASKQVEETALKQFLAAVLPAYMVPAYYIHVNRIPVTSNGKADRKALQALPLKSELPFSSPATRQEEELVELWARILDKDPSAISVNKTFFEQGGNSLKLIRLNALVNHQLQIDTTITEMLNYTTIQSFAAFVNGEYTHTPPSEAAIKKEVSDMSAVIDLFK